MSKCIRQFWISEYYLFIFNLKLFYLRAKLRVISPFPKGTGDPPSEFRRQFNVARFDTGSLSDEC